MRKFALTLVATATLMAATQAQAGTIGAASTDRFGYTGTLTRYATLADAQAQTNAVEQIPIGNRDLSLYLVNELPAYDTNYNVIMGSWWYTTVDNTNGYPKDHPDGDRLYSGWGNTRGNTGIGFMQIYDADGSTDTSVDMYFDNFDGAHWTEFNLSITGGGAGYDPNDPSNDYARFSIYQNTDDRGLYHSYSLNLTATGLEGMESTPGLIEADNHPTGVTGTYDAIFEHNDPDEPTHNAFYVVDLDLDMTNWAFEQGDEALNGNFYGSYFVAVPEPATLALLILGAGLIRRR